MMHQESRSDKGLKLFGMRILGDGGGGKEAAEDVEKVIRKSKSIENLVTCGFTSFAESSVDNNGYLFDNDLVQLFFDRTRQY